MEGSATTKLTTPNNIEGSAMTEFMTTTMLMDEQVYDSYLIT